MFMVKNSNLRNWNLSITEIQMNLKIFEEIKTPIMLKFFFTENSRNLNWDSHFQFCPVWAFLREIFS